MNEPDFMSKPDFIVTPEMLEAEGLIINIADDGLRDPRGRPITYVSDGVAELLAGRSPGALLVGLVDTAAEGEPEGWLWKTTTLGTTVWLQSDGRSSTFLLPDEY